MADEALGGFPGVEAFYDYRGPAGSDDGAPLWLPIHQGDVFEGLTVPGVPLRGGDSMVMAFMHPCVLRKPSTKFVTVFRVRHESDKKHPYEKYDNNYSVMPLIDLNASGKGVHFAEFTMVGVVPHESLSRANRVLSLSREGRLLLQQRAVHHFTRHAPPLHDLRNRTTAVERELALLAQWSEAACNRDGETLEVVTQAEEAFEAFLNESNRRIRLAVDSTAHEVIAEVSREARCRWPLR